MKTVLLASFARRIPVSLAGVLLAVAFTLASPSTKAATYTVDFEGTGETKTSYTSGTVTLNGIQWDMTGALIGTSASDFKNGLRSARMNGYTASAMTMLADKADGAGTISFSYRRYGTDAQQPYAVEYSTDGGATWTQAGSDFTAPASDVVQTFSQDVNQSGNVRMRIRCTGTSTANNRLNIDDISITDFGGVDTTPPTISSLSPADEATGVAVDANLVATFSENVQKATGNIVIRNSADDSVVESIAVTSAAVTVSGAVVTIDPSVTLANLTGYYIQIGAGAFSDLAAPANAFAGILDTTTWSFTTVDANIPAITSFDPATGWTGDNITITGLNLGGALEVTFNGIAAGFTVDSDTQLTATVPADPTAGKIAVTTPYGTATSATNFTPVNPNILSVSIDPATFAENAANPAATGTVTRAGPGTEELVVTLASNDATEATVPESVVIAANQASATFAVAAVDDLLPDGAQTVRITASATGYVSGSSEITVTDDGTDTWPIVISQYYEGASNDKYIEIRNISAADVDLTGFRLTTWTNASAENWKTNTGAPTNNSALPTFTLPAGSCYLMKASSAANPAYAASSANTANAAAGGFNGNDSVVLYYGSGNDVTNIVDAVSCTAANEGADKSFYRLTNDQGYDLTAGTSLLTYPAVWASKTLAEVAAATPADDFYLQAYITPVAPTLATFVLAGDGATTSTGRVTLDYTATDGLPTEYRASESADFSDTAWQAIGVGLAFDLSAGEGAKTVYFQLRNATGESVVLNDMIDAQAYAYDAAVLITQYYEGLSNNKYVELTNVSASDIDLTGWTLANWGNLSAETWKVTGATGATAINLSAIGVLAAGQTVVVANTSAAALTPPAALVSGNINHNGNDSYALYSGAVSTETLVDAVGFTNLGSEGLDKSFVRQTNDQGFDFAAGSTVVSFPAVWQEVTLDAVAAATPSQNAYLGTYPGSAGGGYADWATVNAGGQAANLDFDNDGVPNGIEFFLGATGSTFTTSPGIVDGKVAWPNGGNIDSTTYGPGSFVVETSTDLVTWTPVAADDPNLLNTSTAVEYSLPPGAGRLFVRLSVTPAL